MIKLHLLDGSAVLLGAKPGGHGSSSSGEAPLPQKDVHYRKLRTMCVFGNIVKAPLSDHGPDGTKSPRKQYLIMIPRTFCCRHVGKQSCELLQDFPKAKNLPGSSPGRFSAAVAQFREGSCRAHLATHLNGSLWHSGLKKMTLLRDSGRESTTRGALVRTWESKAVFLDFLENSWLSLSEIILWTESIAVLVFWKAKLMQAGWV